MVSVQARLRRIHERRVLLDLSCSVRLRAFLPAHRLQLAHRQTDPQLPQSQERHEEPATSALQPRVLRYVHTTAG